MPAASVDSIGQTSNIKQASNKQKVAGWFWNLLTPRNSGSPSYWRNVPLLLVQYLSKNQIIPPIFLGNLQVQPLESWEAVTEDTLFHHEFKDSTSANAGYKLGCCFWFSKWIDICKARQLWWFYIHLSLAFPKMFFSLPKKRHSSLLARAPSDPPWSRDSPPTLNQPGKKPNRCDVFFVMHSLPTKKTVSKLGKSPGNVPYTTMLSVLV